MGVDARSDLGGRHLLLDREREGVDGRLRAVAQELGAEDAVGSLFDENLRPGDALTVGSRSTPGAVAGKEDIGVVDASQILVDLDPTRVECDPRRR